MPRAAGDQRGFTLVELIISVVILGTIVAGMGSIFYVSRRAEDQASASFAANDDLATASVYFQRDVNSADPSEVRRNEPGGCSGQQSLLVLSWVDESTGEPFEADYVLDGATLLRTVCHDVSEEPEPPEEPECPDPESEECPEPPEPPEVEPIWEVLAHNVLARGVRDVRVEDVGGDQGLQLVLDARGGETHRVLSYFRSD